MGLTTAALNYYQDAIIGGSSFTKFNNAAAHLGVGDSTTAFDVSDTDLQAVTNKVRVAMEATYPQRTDAELTFRAVFGTGAGNFAWQEWGIFNASTAGEMLSRKVESLGTKTSAASWELTVTSELVFPA